MAHKRIIADYSEYQPHIQLLARITGLHTANGSPPNIGLIAGLLAHITGSLAAMSSLFAGTLGGTISATAAVSSHYDQHITALIARY